MEKLEKEYQIGYELGINLIDKLGVVTKEQPNVNHLAGVLSCILNFAYFSAPNDNAVNELIKVCKKTAKENIVKHESSVDIQ